MSCQDDHCKFAYVQAEKGFSNSKEHRHGKLNWKRTAASKNGGESVNCLFLATQVQLVLQHVKQLSCASTRKSFFESWTLFRLSDAPRNTHSHHCGPIVQEKIFVWQGIWKDLMWFKFQRLIPINSNVTNNVDIQENLRCMDTMYLKRQTQVAAKLLQATNKHCSECLRASHWVAAKHKSAEVLPPRDTMQGQTNNTSETALRMVRLSHRSRPRSQISHLWRNHHGKHWTHTLMPFCPGNVCPIIRGLIPGPK